MIPSPQQLATLAIRRREEFAASLTEATSEGSDSSLLPGVLRRCIATTAVSHQVLGALDRVVSSTTRLLGNHQAQSVEPEWTSSTDQAFPGLWRNHLSLAVNRALISYGEILRAMDWRIQRQSMDLFLEFLSSIEVVGGKTSRPRSLDALIEGALRIKMMQEARRPQPAIAGILFRDHESFNVEATAWCYCAALLTDVIWSRADGSAGVRNAVRRVDGLRADLEKALVPARPPAPAKTPVARPAATPAARPTPRVPVAAKP